MNSYEIKDLRQWTDKNWETWRYDYFKFLQEDPEGHLCDIIDIVNGIEL